MPGTTRLFCASTPFGTATLAAALDAGMFEPTDRRVLLVAHHAANPETTPAADAMLGFRRIAERFDEVLSWNETIAPFHPGGWAPRADDIPMWERYVRRLWGLGDDEVRLVVESVRGNPAPALCRLFTGAPVDVCADGLMGYGPSCEKVDPLVGTRIDRLLHVDLVPGLVPLLLTEFGVPAMPVPIGALLKVLAELAEEGGEVGQGEEPPALLLGECLAAQGVLGEAEEDELLLRMVRGAVDLGHRHLILKPHPAAPVRWSRVLEEEAARLGARLTVLEDHMLAEVVVQRTRPALVVGSCSTALLTAARLYGVPVARVGTDTVLARLTPYQHSRRIPLTLVDAVLPDVGDPPAVAGRRTPSAERTDALLKAVGYAMQPQILPGLRADAERYLARRLDAGTRRYFMRRRLASLGLPGGVPARLAFLARNATVRRIARRARALARR